MAILLPILRYPDPRLHRIARPVLAVDERIRALADDMLATMYQAQGIGLAATQGDVHERLLVGDVSGEHDPPLGLVNPQNIWTRAGEKTQKEGCLSVPGIYDDVERFDAVHVRALDTRGQPQVIEADGLLAMCLQHEMDHLQGKVFVQYLSPLKRNRIKTRMIKQQREARA